MPLLERWIPYVKPGGASAIARVNATFDQANIGMTTIEANKPFCLP